MKTKHIIYTLLLVVITTISKAQFFDAGLKIGLVASQVDGDTYSGFDKLGFDIGAYVNYHLTQKTSIQMELEFIQKGSSHTPNYEIGDMEQYLLRLNYIQVPILWHYQASSLISFETGPAFGVLMSSFEEKYESPVVNHPFRKFALSYILGLEYNLNTNWKANIRIDYSLLALRQNPYVGDRNIFFQWGQFNNAIVLSFQYIIKHAQGK